MPKRILAFLLLSLPLGLPAPAQTLDSTFWAPNGRVETIVRSGNTIYLGGDFTHVQPNTGGGGIMSPADGQLVHNPRIEGTVRASVPDGNGGWFIGGEFTRVQGWFQPWLAHLLADGNIDKTWNPRLTGPVLAMTAAGGTLYIGGMFVSVDDQRRPSLAALNAATGELTGWNPEANGAVYSLAAVGSTIYAGGGFTAINGQARNFAAALDAVTGQPRAWNPGPSQAVHTLAVAGNTVYLGGFFNAVGGQYRQNLAAVDAVSGQLTAWNPGADRDVTTLLADNGTVYAVGAFGTVGGQLRSSAAAIDAVTGQVTDWNPQVQFTKMGVSAVAVSGNTVYLGGNFTSVGNADRTNLAAVDAATGQLTAWNPWMPVSGMLDVGVATLSVSGSNVFVGGDFTTVGGQARQNLASLDVLSGRPTAWNPVADSAVTRMAVAGGKVYMVGRFTAVGGQSRDQVAAVDAATGAVTAWKPDYQGWLATLVASGDTLYIGGSFLWQGQMHRVVAIDGATGQLIPWSANINNWVSTLAVAGNTVYLAGGFTEVGGQARNKLAAVDATTGQVTPWNPNPNEFVGSLAVVGNTVYAAGGFKTIGGQSRSFLAALDAATGRATPWNPAPNSSVLTLTADAGTIFAGGYFNAVNGQGRNQLAAIDAVTGQPTAWNPNLNVIPSALALYDGRLYVGGPFPADGGRSIRGLSVFDAKAAGFNLIRGNVYEDADGDCVKDANERGIPGRVMVARPGNYFATTDSLGEYTLSVPSGSYTVQQVIPAEYQAMIRQLCPANSAGHPVSFTGYDNAVGGKDFANQTQVHPALTVSVASLARRRCFRSVTVVDYTNRGNGPAQGVKVFVKLPPYVVPISASVPYQLDPDKNLVFDVGNLAPGARSIIYLSDSVVCNNPGIRGLTQCTKAWIVPENARPAAPGWDGSDVALKGACGSNGTVRLVLHNKGAGRMADSSAFRVYLDAQLALSRNFSLEPGDSLTLQVPANGQTVRLEADQRPAHPRKKQSSITLEACGTNAGGLVSMGFVNKFSHDDEEPEADIECLPITDSFDPNDKAVSPEGVTDQHYTPTGQALDYVIRFQNTGTDVAYKVVVTDTLSEHLDLATLQVGATSHACKVTVSGQGRPVLTFTFNNIMLPDSTRDKRGSNGFIRFRIKPRADLPEKTRIENFADIFFDYNEPVRTNTVSNRIYDVPPVVAEAVRLDGGVVCHQARATPSVGASRSVCRQDTVHLRATPPEFGRGSWVRISGAGTVPDTGNPVVLVTGLAYGDNVFEWRIPANACTTDSLRARVTVTRLRPPASPVIVPAGTDSLACNETGRAYAWYLDGTPLGLSARTIRAVREGSYTVRVTDEAGCASDLSAPFAYVLTAIRASAASRVSLYPNPATGRVAVVLPAGLGPQVHIAVYDALGRLVASRRVPPAAGERKEEFDLSACRPGVLLFKLQTPQGVVTRRLVRSSR